MNKNISNSNSSPLPTGEGQGVRLEAIRSVYFVGAGGIGMSALIRYFLSKGKTVAGYDRTSSELTERLITEGAQIHYEEDINLIPEECKDKASTLVVYTPAVPQGHAELTYFRENGFDIHKRSQVLGIITRSSKGLCVAGTHGKTTTSTMAAHLLHQSHVGCTAFLGGISKNYGTNLLLSATSPYTVIEADEFDRSFHWLSPWMSVITATDPDHLDIYGTKEAYLESFRHYTTLIQPGGALILHKGLEMQADVQPGVTTYTYSRNEGDFHAENIRIGNGEIFIDFVAPDTRINDIQLGVPVSINIENGVAAMALAHLSGATDEEIKQGMASFRGVDRRFDFKLKNDRIVFLSDYAHHPAEIAQSVKSVRELYQDKKITVIFQPHLYTRTRDFYRDFADSLSLSDEVILTEIYPAREQPIPGVTSQLIYDNLRPGIEKCICRKEDVLSLLAQKHTEVLVVLGAGDLDNYAPQITQLLSENIMVKRILLSIVLLLVIAYLVVAVTAFNRKPTSQVCQDVELVIKDTVYAGFITKKEVATLLEKKGISPIGKDLERVRTKTLERELAKHPLIDQVECYKTPSGKLCIEVTQRTPILRVMSANGENYYLDNKGTVMPPDAKCVAHLAVVTGNVEKSFAMRDLYKFGVFLQKNSFWNAQIEQIHVLPGKNIELVPRVGDHLIYLGKIAGFEKKLKRVKAFYERGLNQVGWNKYSRISVEFDNQIICTKRE